MIKKNLINLLSHAKKYVVYNVLCQWIALLAQIAAIFTISGLLEKIIFGNVSLKGELWTEIGKSAIILLAVIVIRYLCDRLAAKSSYAASVDVKRILREKIYNKLLKLGVSYRDKVSTSEVVQLSTEGVEQLETYFGKYLPQLFYSLLAPVTLFIILSFVDFKASLVLLICVPLIPVSIVAVQKFAKKLLNKYWGIYTSLGDSFLENLQGLTTLKIYEADEMKAKEMDEEASRFRKITMKVLTMQLNSTSVMDIVAYGGAAVGMVVVLKEFFAGNVNFAGTLTIVLLASEFFIPLRLLGSFFHIAMNGMAASDKIFNLLGLEEPQDGTKDFPCLNEEKIEYNAKDSTENRMEDGAIVTSGNAIEFENVEFSYEENRKILKEIYLSLPKGSFISLVGESGCGKSTIAGLLTGTLKGYQGKIAIGGVELSEIKEEEILKNITLIRHNSYLFKGTVEENLRMAKLDATEEELEAVLQKVNLLGFLREQQGLKTLLQEKGSNFSGGQCQRLALARGLLHDSPIYIFDEATSNIDAESEEMIMEVIHEMAKEKMVLLISHRLSNVIDSDCIYFLKDGRIAESGTHKELLMKEGAYANLYENQRKLEAFAALGKAEKRTAACESNLESSLDSNIECNLKSNLESELKSNFKDNNFSSNKADSLAEKEKKQESTRRSAVVIMGKLIGLVKPLFPIMMAAILLGTLGYLSAIFLTIFAGQGILSGLKELFDIVAAKNGNGVWIAHLTGVKVLFVCMIVMAVLRGVLHYIEQYCNHFIAFKLLAIIRHKVFASLCRLCPAKLEGRDKGNLISIITTDIELLEVFYAHTISPIAIAILTSTFMTIFIGRYQVWAGVLAAGAYLVVGCLIPIWNGRHGSKNGMEYRNAFGEMNSFVLDSLRGLDETIRYHQGSKRGNELTERSKELGKKQRKLSHLESVQRSLTNLVILLFSFGMLFLCLSFYQKGTISLAGVIICTISMMGSFGPVVALSALSNNLNQTLASGERVLRVLEEEPIVEEVPEGEMPERKVLEAEVSGEETPERKVITGKVSRETVGKENLRFTGASMEHVTFSYEDEVILSDYSIDLEPGKIIGIHGASGSGKSTMLKLLMRFWDVQQGSVNINKENIKKLPTTTLRKLEGYMTQETHLFHDSIANNIAIGKVGASREEIMEAAKKASIHEFIMTLPDGYDTQVGELGETLSGGERQRIGIARAFLHDAQLLLLDEPTSNLDSLNEGIILKSMKESAEEKTVVLVSHRESTMQVADVIFKMNHGRLS